jgi:hypothetical protein
MLKEETNRRQGVPNRASGGESIFADDGVSEGDTICMVSDFDLAICLLTLGFKVKGKDGINHLRLKDGTDKFSFVFNNEDTSQQYKASEMVKAFKHYSKFLQDNPDHPMSVAMVALKNKAVMLNLLKQSVPYIALKPSGSSTATIFVQEGSKRHKNCIANGMVQVDPISYL